MAMDVKRDPKILRRKKIRRAIIVGIVLIGVGALTVAVSRLKPAAPTVDSQPWVGTVQRGSFTREVRGSGTLVPVDIRWIPAVTSGRVEQLVLHPGDAVTPNSVILDPRRIPTSSRASSRPSWPGNPAWRTSRTSKPT